MFETKLTKSFNAEYPIMNAGMGRVAGGDLAGSISEAGGIGVIGATGMSPSQLKKEIETARTYSQGPLIVDILFPKDSPDSNEDAPHPSYIPSPVEKLRGELQEKGADVPDFEDVDVNLFEKQNAESLLDIAISKEVDGIATAVGSPDWAINRAQDADIKVVSLAGRVKHAVSSEKAGADFIVADGTEGGGHSGPVSTLELVPLIRNEVEVPVIASGGITTGSQMLANIVNGAEGVWIGTRFIPTEESAVENDYKRRIISTKEDDCTVRSKLYDGMPIRMLNNRLTEAWKEEEDKILDYPEQAILMGAIDQGAKQIGATEYKVLGAGQGTPLINDIEKPPSARTVLESLVQECKVAYQRTKTLKK